MKIQYVTVQDVILPIFLGNTNGGNFVYDSIAGTAFLIGKSGIGLTAAHVIDQIASSKQEAVIGFNDGGKWLPLHIHESEKHDVEDVAAFRCDPVKTSSWLTIEEGPAVASDNYSAWGYPQDVAKLPEKYEEHKLQRPELIYTRGYIRRRISRELPVAFLRGKSFYEMSELAGHSYSGAPIIRERGPINRAPWKVIGIYVGEHRGEFQASYAVRSDSFHNWSPKILGRTLREESLDLDKPS